MIKEGSENNINISYYGRVYCTPNVLCVWGCVQVQSYVAPGKVYGMFDYSTYNQGTL